MNLDDEICCCYHVSLRKLLSYARRKRPRYASQLSDCLGAGTGCGWCIPVLKRIQAAASGELHPAPTAGEDAPPAAAVDLPNTADEYAASRQTYIKSGRKNSF